MDRFSYPTQPVRYKMDDEYQMILQKSYEVLTTTLRKFSNHSEENLLRINSKSVLIKI